MSTILSDQSAHNFALWFPTVDALHPTFVGPYPIHDAELLHRLRRVLRIKKDDIITLFGRRHTLQAVVVSTVDETILFCQKISRIMPLCPEIILYLPLLQKEAFEEAIRRATILGVRTIYPLITEKVKRTTLSVHEYMRLERIMISAAEQSKQFYLPEVTAVISWHEITTAQLIWFDQHGERFSCAPFFSGACSSLSLIIGPEGDFSQIEKVWFKERGIKNYRLSETVLRSEDALMVALGILRTYLPIEGK